MAIRRFRELFAILLANPHPIRLVVSRLLWRTGLCRHLLIRRPGFSLRFFPTSLSAAYWIDPEDRNHDERLIRLLLKPGDTYIDVGANIGALALCASTAVGKHGLVYAIEPHPRTYRFLTENVSLNGRANIRCLHSAVGAQAGTLLIADGSADDQNCIVREGGVPVAVNTLDELLRESNTSIALLKIDVEGYELPVLSGASNALQRSQAVLFEVWEKHLGKYGHQTSDVVALVRRAGFGVFTAHLDEKQLVPIPDRYTAERCENLFALRSPAEFCRSHGFSIA